TRSPQSVSRSIRQAGGPGAGGGIGPATATNASRISARRDFQSSAEAASRGPSGDRTSIGRKASRRGRAGAGGGRRGEGDGRQHGGREERQAEGHRAGMAGRRERGTRRRPSPVPLFPLIARGR